jgi:hypothetical protein
MDQSLLKRFNALLLTILFLSVSPMVKAQLSAGDIAIVGCNRLVPYELAIVALKDIPSGTTIYISDYPYANASSGFVNTSNTSEGAITWTTTSTVTKGTVLLIKISNVATGTPTLSGLPGTISITGWISGSTASTPVPAGGDNWFIYLGSSPTSPSTFIFGWTNYATTTFGSANGWLSNGTQNPSNTSTSELPPGLTNGTNAISLSWLTGSGGSHGDNNVYTGILSGTQAQILSAICSTSNWNHDEVTTYQLTSASSGTTQSGGSSYFTGSTPFTIGSGCTMSASITAQTNVACNGGSTGSLTVTQSGGTSNYSYSWTNGSTTSNSSSSSNTISSLAAGSYTVTVTDANSCTATASATITQPTAISATANSQTNVSCNGGSTGAASINTPTGGAGGYTYNWTPGNPTGDGTTSVTGLTAQNYTCTITDANSCTKTVTFSITQPTAISATANSQTNVSCNGGSNGAASINTPTGGAGGYTYDWTPGNPTGDGTISVTGLTAQNYTCTITDANSCTKTVTFSITQPTAISATANSQTNVSCNGGSNGAASINTPTGGAGGYTYDWTPGNPTGDGTTSVTGLTAQNYTCTITDANSCTKTVTFSITQPTAISATANSQTNVSCNGGSNGAASINTPTGGAGGYTYDWTPGNPTGDGTTSVTGLTAQNYTCTITDANSCTKTVTFSITQPTAISATANSQTNVSCNGGSNGAASINTPTGGAGGYTYDWTPGNPTGDGTTSVTGLTAQNYTCTITDANSCTKTVTFSITQPTAISATANSQTNVSCNGGSNGAASINTPTGGAGGYTYDWTPGNPTGDGTTSVTGLTAQNYTCTITDANSCTKTVTFSITQPTAISVTASSQTNITCNGASTGAASINTPTGGAGGYTYDWTPGNPTGDGTTSVTGLTAQNYTCTVTDANSCTATSTFAITQPTAISTSVSAQSNVSCPLDATGSATISASGGTGSLGYSWAPSGGTAASATGLTAQTYTVTVTDANSCSKTQAVTITANDATAPVATAQDITVYLNASGTASITGAQVNNGSTDNCSISSLSVSPNSFSCANVGSNSVTLTVTDNNSNSSTAAATVTVQDTIKPIAVAQNITVYLNASGTASITASQVNNGSSDACGISSLSVSPNSFTCANVGSNTVTLTVQDNNGNSSTATATVTVQDTIKPTAVAQNITVYLNALGTASITASQVNNGSSDACGISSLSVSPNSFSCANVGSNTVTLTVQDNNGNSKTATATVTVQDTIKPTAAAQNITVYLNATGTATITGSQVNNGSSDACGISSLSVSPNSFSCANVGSNTVTLTVQDNNGNSSTATATVTVQDTVKPIAAAQNITAYLNASGTASITASQVNSGSSDACGISSLSVSPNSFTCANVGSNTVTLTVQDNNGNSSTATATVTVQDTIKPTAAAQNITVYLNASGTATITGSQVNNGSSDACGISSLSVSPNSFSCANVGSNTVTLTVQDNNGNSNTATATVTVQDTIKPTAVAQNITAYLNASGTVTITGSQVNNGSSDACGISSLSVSPNSFSCANVGSNTVTLTVQDNNGNSSTATATVTVQDTVKPTAVAQNITVYLNAAGTASITASQVNNGSSDACGISSLSVSPNSFTCANAGSNTVTLTVQDNNGNSKTATATVTVQDTIKPTAVAQNITVYLNASGTATITGSQVNNGSSDACGISSLSVSPNSFSCANVGSNTVTLTVQDNNGNSSTATATVTVQDTVKPIAVAQNITVYLNASGTASITASQVNSGSSDACGISSLSVSPNSFTCANVGSNTVTLTVQDNNGNSKTATATVTVQDTIKPTAVAQNITVYLNASGTATITGSQVNNGSSDACGIASLSVSPNSFTCANVGSNTVTLTVQDNNGNSKTATATVTVQDTVKPTAVAQNITVYLNASGTATITGSQVNNGSSDACGISTLSVSPNSFSCANVGSNSVTLTVQDNNGNSSTATATVTVQDTVKPIAAAQNITVYLNASGTASITASQINNGSSDACGISSLSVSPNSFTCANAGSNTVTLTVQDNNGNSKTATATVTVQDTIKPTAVAQNITVYLNASGTATITGSQVNNGSSDACGIASLSVSPNSFSCANVGSNTVTLTVQDNNGNSKTATATVTVQDTVKPTAIAQNITVYLNASGTASITASQVNNGSSDACGIASTSVSPNSFTCANVGSNTVTLTVQDNNGNSKTATATVTVQDTVKPTAVAQNITVYLNASGTASITASQVNNGSSDACGIASTSVSPNSFTCANVGSNTVTLTVQDNNGNSKTATATVTVQDTVKPTAVAQNITVYLNASGTATITGSQVNNGSSDACGISTLSVSPNSFSCANVGSNTVTLTVQDNNGNSKTATATVTVQDTVKPTAVAQNITVYLNAAGTASITASQINNGSSDACGIASTSVSPNSFTCANVGSNTVTLTVQDNNGNSKTATATVTVQDTVKPTAIAQNITVYLNASGTASITASQVNNGSSDACGIASTSVSPNSFTCANVGSNTVTLTVQDNNGNSKTATATVTVQDTIKPSVIAQNRTIYLNASGAASVTASQVNNGSTDACGIASSVLSKTSFNCTNVGANTVWLTITDVNGNKDSVSATITVSDTVKPVVSAQNKTIYLDATGNASVTATEVNNGSGDACGIASTTLNKTTFGCSNTGANTVWLRVTDVNNNTDSVSATVTVLDTIAPVISCKTDTAILDVNGNVTITPADVTGSAADNCSIASSSLSRTSFTTSDVGNNSVTLTVMDASGNTSTCTANVLVVEPKPVAICQNATIYLNASGSATLAVSQVDNGSHSLVGITDRTLSKTNFTCADLGSNTVKLVVTNSFNNKDSCTATVTVLDTIKPTVLVKNVTKYLNASGVAGITISDINNGTYDNCSGLVLSVSKTSFNCSNAGMNTVWLTATDTSGNKDSVSATVNILDTIKPVVNLQSNVVLYLNAAGNVNITTATLNNGSTDNCGIDTMYLSKTTLTCDDLGINPVTLTVKDKNGNIDSAALNVVVLDPIAPVARPKAKVVVYLSNNGQAVINPSLIDSASSDNCTITSRVLSQTVFTCTQIGNNTITFTVQDQSGNSSFANAVVEVRDTIKPNVIVSNQTLYLNAGGTVSITPSLVNNNSTDNCGIDSIWTSKSTFTCSDLGNNTISLFARDVNGNTSSANVLINVFDTIRPMLRAKQNIVLYVDAAGSASLTTAMADSSSADNCTLSSLSLSKTSFNCSNIGNNTVTLSGTDGSANTSSVNFNVLVRDTIRPDLTTANATIYLNAVGQASVTASALTGTTTDNCSNPTVSLSKYNFTCADKGNNVVVVTSADASGNSISANATVTVLDTVRPVVSANNLSVYLNAAGTVSITTTQANNSSYDNCGISSYNLSKTTFNGSELGMNTVTLSATDGSGNTGSVNFTVTVLDSSKPVVVTNNISAYLNASGSAVITAAQINNGSTDNAGITNLSLSKTVFTCADLGTNVITLSATDASNNTGTGTATVTIIDTIKPVIVTKNITVYLNGIGAATITAADLSSSSTDNCSIASLTASKTSFTCDNRGANSITLTITDVAGNSVSASATVTVLDTIKPNVVVNNNLNIYLDATGNAALTTAQVNNSSTDNCDIASFSLGKTAFTAVDLGLNVISFSATDASGNTKTVNINVTVLDSIKPVVKGLNKTIYLNNTGTAAITAAEVNNGSTDNVGISFISLNKASFNCSDLGVNTVQLTATDASNNTSFTSVEITVLDTIKPVLSGVPSNLTFGLCGAVVNYTLPTASDNCAVAKVEQLAGIPAGGTYPVGTTTNTFRISDASGNSVTTSFTVTIYPSYLPVTFTNLEMCSNASRVDLSQGKDSLVFSGSGVLADRITFDPAVAGAGNHAITYVFTDTTGCETSGVLLITVNGAPVKPIIDRVTSATLKVRDVYDSYQWYRYEEQLEGETNQTMLIKRTGVYSVSVSNRFGCVSKSDPIGIGVPTPVGLNSVNDNVSFKVFPNPSAGRFVIEKNSTAQGATQIVVTDVVGKEVLRTTSMDDIIEMDLTAIAAGTYYIRLENNGSVSIKPIVIKN